MSEFRNRLIASLPPEELALLVPRLERVPLEFGRVLYDVNERMEDVWFPESAVISSVSVMLDGSAVETATIGREGMAGMGVFHGVDRLPEHVYIQVPGDGYRMAAADLRAVLERAPTLRAVLHRFAAALFTLVGQSSGCNRKHAMAQRCARWLLLTHDRVGRDEFELTHLVLSQMLGVRRASVTEIAIRFQRQGMIRYTRGRVTVLDRAALERASCECYGVIRSTFDRLLGGGDTPNPLDGITITEGGMSAAKDGTPDPENDPERTA